MKANKIIVFLFFVFYCKSTFSQKKYTEWGLHVKPAFAGSFLSIKSTSLDVDSIKKSNVWRPGISFGLSFIRKTSQRQKFELGVYYHDWGYRRKGFNYQYGDMVHPEIGFVVDNSQTVSKDVYFDYRFRYLTIPATFYINLQQRKTYQDYDFYFIASLAPSFLLNDILFADLRGWSAFGKSEFNIKKHGFDVANFNIGSSIGFCMDYKMMKNTRLSVSPMFGLNFIPAKNSAESNLMANFGIDLCLSVSLNKDATKRVDD